MKPIVTARILVFALVCSSVLFSQEQLENGEAASKAELEFLELAKQFNADTKLIVESHMSGKEIDIEFPEASMVDDFLNLESNNRGTRVGFSCLFQLVVQAGRFSQVDFKATMGKQKALRILGDQYADYPDIDSTFRHLMSGARVPESANFLRKAIKTTSLEDVKANAMLTLANMLATEASFAANIESRLSLLDHESAIELKQEYTQQFADIDSDTWRGEARDEARRMLKTLATAYPDVLEPPLTDSRKPSLIQIERSDVDALTHANRRRVVDRIPSATFELEHSIGQKPPEIDQEDVAGNAMRLSEFRGKVVVLMFSYTGCGPCEEMYPRNRELVEELAGKPFVFVSVMRDPKLETTSTAIASKKITWRVWLDGEATISQQWNVRAWPTIYVIDSGGVIRYEGLRGENLSLAVHKLLDED